MKEQVDYLIIIPAPESHYNMVLDVIDSIECYTSVSYKIIVIDDSGAGLLKARFKKEQNKPNVTFICNDAQLGKQGGLFVSFARAYKFCLEQYDFKIVLRMDTDALITHFGLFEETYDFFQKNPQTGILGSYTIKSDGTKREWWQWALVLLWESSLFRLVVGKKRLWHTILKRARKNNYSLGENVFGGACIYSHQCLAAMNELGYLNITPKTLIEEDVIFSLLAKAAGYDLEDFGKPHQSMSLGMYSLPISKEKIVMGNKKLIHSMKQGLHGESEDELRRFFQQKRLSINK